MPNKPAVIYILNIVDTLLLFLFCKSLWIKASAKSMKVKGALVNALKTGPSH